VPGRRTPEAKGLRTEAVAAGQLYLDAVRRAGGEPAIVAPTDDAERLATTLARFDGLLLLGGGDIDPHRYGATEVREEVRGVDRADGGVVGVQWHPEDTAADDPEQQAIFDAFVAECARLRGAS